MTEKLNQEKRYGVCFEKELPYLIERLGITMEGSLNT